MPTLSSKPPAAYYADHDNGVNQRLAAVWLESAAYYAATRDAIGNRIIIGSQGNRFSRPRNVVSIPPGPTMPITDSMTIRSVAFTVCER